MNWKEIVSNVAPVLGTALGGPLGGAAVSALAKALGLSETTEEAVKAALGQGATPDQLLAIKKADQDFALGTLKANNELTIKLEEFRVADLNGARKRDSDTRDNVNRNLAYAVVGTFLGSSALVLGGVFNADTALSTQVLSYLQAGSTMIFGYYFGSTFGSLKKTELVAGAYKDNNNKKEGK